MKNNKKIYYSIDYSKTQATFPNNPKPVHSAQATLAFVEETPVEIKATELPIIQTIIEDKTMPSKAAEAKEIQSLWINFFHDHIDQKELIEELSKIPSQSGLSEILSIYSEDIPNPFEQWHYIPSSWC